VEERLGNIISFPWQGLQLITNESFLSLSRNFLFSCFTLLHLTDSFPLSLAQKELHYNLFLSKVVLSEKF